MCSQRCAALRRRELDRECRWIRAAGPGHGKFVPVEQQPSMLVGDHYRQAAIGKANGGCVYPVATATRFDEPRRMRAQLVGAEQQRRLLRRQRRRRWLPRRQIDAALFGEFEKPAPPLERALVRLALQPGRRQNEAVAWDAEKFEDIEYGCFVGSDKILVNNH